jgi:peptidoglycan/LPS O-acetylase OafA/YrhL
MRQPTGEDVVTENFVEILVLAVLPALVAAAIVIVTRTVIDARTRRKLIDSRLPADVIQAFAAVDQSARILAALRWGVIGVSLSVGLLILQFFPKPHDIARDLGVIVLCGSLGLLLFHRVAPRPPRADHLFLSNSELPAGEADQGRE